ncbi:MAG TPA: GYD domain-containing protein [Tepidisphaeraceae bacterium]|jgi:uncharacterized protein with GYD domain
MVRFITLWNWTDKGVAKIDETIDRAEAFAAAAEKAGVRVKEFFWTVGEYDGFLVTEAPDETSAIAAIAHVARLGNIRTRTLRALDAADMRQVLGKLENAASGGKSRTSHSK